jgi:hypothetical protein
MRFFYSYIRLLIASTLLMGGLGLQFVPSQSAVARGVRWRARQLEAVPAAEREKWIAERDNEDSSAEAAVRVFGVLLGGLGLGGALLETAYLGGRFVRG